MIKNIKNRNIIFYIIIAIFAINIFSIISDALIDCSKCHTTDPGKSSIKAKDTIVINDTTCLMCHNPNYPPTPIGYNTHLAHVGKYSAKVNFLGRHPEVTKSLQCGDCHKQIFDCTNCHVNGIPHIPPPLGLNCQGCHNQIDNLFRHPTINLTIHNIFHLNSTKDCQMCHNADNMKSLKLASGDTVSIDQAYNLCKQCHSGIYKSWDNGQHYANKTVPIDVATAEDPNVMTEFENNWLSQNSCVNCHNPHNPSQLYVLPIPIAKTSEPTSLLLYAIPVALISIIILIVVKYDLKNSIILKLSALGKISLPKMPKLSLPISVTLDDGDTKQKEIDIQKTKEEIGDGKESPASHIPAPDMLAIDIDKEEYIVEKDIGVKSHHTFDDLDKKLEKLIEGVSEGVSANVSNKGAKKLFGKYRGDILFVAGIVAMFSIFYIVFGTFMPMSVAISESMSPHIEKGDLVFFTDISRVDNIKTFDDGKINDYKTFENYGDVIIYKPFGQDGVTPIIHRAMYYVNKGEPMWSGGPAAPSDGYMTKGDNNPDYDQRFTISNLQPVKKEWVEGVAKYRIPYVGYIRLWI